MGQRLAAGLPSPSRGCAPRGRNSVLGVASPRSWIFGTCGRAAVVSGGRSRWRLMGDRDVELAVRRASSGRFSTKRSGCEMPHLRHLVGAFWRLCHPPVSPPVCYPKTWSSYCRFCCGQSKHTVLNLEPQQDIRRVAAIGSIPKHLEPSYGQFLR